MKPKIAFISYEYPPDRAKGGIATYIREMGMLLSSNGLIVHVFASSNERSGLYMDGNVFVHWILSLSPEIFSKKVVEVFSHVHRSVDFDLIESPEIHANALYVKEQFPEIPLLIRLHGPNFLIEKLKTTYIPTSVKLRYLLGSLRRGKIDLGYWRKYKKESDPDYRSAVRADHITAPSNLMKELAIRHWDLDPNNISVIHNPFKPGIKFSTHPIPQKNIFKTILFYGRLNVLKGLFNGTKAIKQILKKYPDWHFKVIGDDGPGPNPLKSTMQQWMETQLCEYSSQVNFISGISYEQVPQEIANAEIMIIPSLFESFSYVCVEAMAAGKAVVGSRLGGISELIIHERNGLLIDPYSVNDIIFQVERLIINPHFRYEIAVQARNFVMNSSRDKSITEQSINLYSSMIHK